MNISDVLYSTAYGGVAAAGFGVLFNVSFRTVPWCALSGCLALAVRTLCLASGWSMEGSSFLAALTLGFVIQILPPIVGVSRSALHVAGCIPMIPGGFATKAILSLFAITHPTTNSESLLTALDNLLRVVLTVGSLGTGLAIPILLVRTQQSAAAPLKNKVASTRR